MSLEMSSEPPGSRLRREGEAQGLSGARSRRLRLGLHGRRASRCRNSSRRSSAPTPERARQHREDARRLQLGADARRRDRLRAQLEPALDRHAARARRRRHRDGHELAAAVDRQGAAAAGAATRVRLPLRGDPPADREFADARLRAHHAVRRAVHRADPAQQPLQRREHERADRRHAHDVLLHRVERRRRQAGIDQEAWRKFCGAQLGIDLDRTYRKRCARATTTTCRTARR